MAVSMSYEAELEREYQELTRKHEAIKRGLTAAVSTYITEGRGKPITIQGPYGSGKTQLLYHLFKSAWDQGAIGIYTHLERIIPDHEMASADYADHLKQLLDQEVLLLQKGESRLMSGRLGRVKDYAASRIGQLAGSSHPIVLLVDEIEQQYKSLDETVKTDDHSPMKETLRAVERGDAGFYLILAFAPVSFYEFSKGEAQTRSFLPMMLPILKAENLRETLGRRGNFIWWLGRGRYGWSLKASDTLETNLANIDECPKKEFLDVCRNMGLIGGVPPLVAENIEAVDNFDRLRQSLVYLEPDKDGGEIYAGDTRLVKKCRVCRPEHDLDGIIEKSLKASGVLKPTDIAYYLSLLLDAISSIEGNRPLYTDPDDWRELFRMVGDIILEFEGEELLPSDDLDKLGSDLDFVFSVRRDAESIAPLEEAYCVTPGFIRSLFPFPISSPNLTTKKIAEQRESLGDQTYLGRQDSDGVSVLFFLNEDKTTEYLRQQSRAFLKETRVLVAVNLGDKGEFSLPPLARWLQKEGRLTTITPRGILSDFLASFFYWIRTERSIALPIDGLLQRLSDSQAIEDKEKARKISYYTSRVQEYLDREVPTVPAPKYILGDKTGFDPRIGYAAEVMGFAFVDDQDNLEAMYSFREHFERTEFIRPESNRKQTGVPTALQSLVVGRRKAITKGAVLRRVKESFGGHLAALSEVAGELGRDEFIDIPVDEVSEWIFDGIYLYVKGWRDPSEASLRLQAAESEWNRLVDRVQKLSERMRTFESSVDKSIQLTHSLESDKSSIIGIGKVLSEYESKPSPYTKFLLSEFADTTRTQVVEVKLSQIEKSLQQFLDDVDSPMKSYTSGITEIKGFDKDTLLFVGKTRDELRQEFQEQLRNACQGLTKGARLNLENMPDTTDFVETIGEITDELKGLADVDDDIRSCKTSAKGINQKLRAWRKG